jgi:hypothetical protein
MFDVQIKSEVSVLYKVVRRLGESTAVFFASKEQAEQAAKEQDASVIEVRFVPAASLPTAFDSGFEKGKAKHLAETVEALGQALQASVDDLVVEGSPGVQREAIRAKVLAAVGLAHDAGFRSGFEAALARVLSDAEAKAADGIRASCERESEFCRAEEKIQVDLKVSLEKIRAAVDAARAVGR